MQLGSDPITGHPDEATIERISRLPIRTRQRRNILRLAGGITWSGDHSPVRPAALLACTAILSAIAPPARATGCSWFGVTYEGRANVAVHPDPRDPPPAYRYRFHIEDLPPGSEGSSVSAVWVFQTVSRRDGKVVGELRMRSTCGNGRVPCSVYAPDQPASDDRYGSEEIALNRDLSISDGVEPPYAFVLPGLSHTAWDPDLVRQQLAADLRFFTPGHVTPDLGSQEVWIRAPCGHQAGVR